jgi:glycosyltransferase involved in cell wall biosynthesis
VKFSIITINLNNKVGLIKTIESVIHQTYIDLEYIVIDGDSMDGSKAVIQQYQDRIDYWVSEPDTGIYQAMNKGIKVAHGEFLLFLNSGDVLVSNTVLEDISQYLDSEDGICSGLMKISDRVSNTTVDPPNEVTLDYLLNGSLPHQATFFSRQIFSDFGLYDENLRIVGDWAYIFKILIIKNINYRRIPFLISLFESKGISSDPKFFALQAKERDEVLKSLFNDRIYSSLAFFRTVSYISSTKQYKLLEKIQPVRSLRRFSYAFLKLMNLFLRAN